MSDRGTVQPGGDGLTGRSALGTWLAMVMDMTTPSPYVHELMRIAAMLHFDLALIETDAVVACTPAVESYLARLSPARRQVLLRRQSSAPVDPSGLTRLARNAADAEADLELFTFETALGRVMLFAGPAFPRRPTAEGLRQLYGLTPAEARVACALAAEESPKELAYRFGVELSTVRTHLRNIQAKLGATSQTDLIRRLLWSAATYVPEIRGIGAVLSQSANARGSSQVTMRLASVAP